MPEFSVPAEECPAWLAEAINAQTAMTSSLVGSVSALAFAVKILAATHPDLESVRRAWFAAKDGQIEQCLLAPTADEQAHQRGFTSCMSAVESIIRKASRQRERDEDE